MFRMMPRALAFLFVLVVVGLILVAAGCSRLLPTSSALSAASGATHM
jgi:hypothetical protein